MIVLYFDVWYQCGRTALIMAAKEGHTSIAEALIVARAIKDLQDEVNIYLVNVNNIYFKSRHRQKKEL